MYLSQTKSTGADKGCVIWRQGDKARIVNGVGSSYQLALSAIANSRSISEEVAACGLGDDVDLVSLLDRGLLDCPVRHPDPAHMFVTGTGLTHLGSAETRNAMHIENSASQTASVEMTDSMKMFQMGVERGKPVDGQQGVQPEWFYKGTGHIVVAPGDPLVSPSFALDGGEEPEIAGLYIIDGEGNPVRLGYALANEFSDHVTERQNYLYLAHSKLRPTSFGPEIFVGNLPDNIEGTSRILRGGETVWQKPFLSGESNMSHFIKNLEYHHFKYSQFCQPNDLHVHMFGTATLSFADDVRVEENDVFEISAPEFGLPLRNSLSHGSQNNVCVRKL